MAAERTLDQLREEYARRRFVAMPVAGAIGWTAAGICGVLLPTGPASLAMFVCVGMIFWLGALIGKLLGEPIIQSAEEQGELDRLFLLTVTSSSLVLGIAVPFYLIEPSSLPLSLGILPGLMWVPFSWMIQHPVGIWHGAVRTAAIVAAWYLFPDARFVAVPGVIVGVCLVSIYVLASRPRAVPVEAG